MPSLLPPPLRARSVKHNPIALRIISTLVPDEELARRTESDIMQFKERNRILFQRYSYLVRELVGRVSLLPLSDDFDVEVDELINTEV